MLKFSSFLHLSLSTACHFSLKGECCWSIQFSIQLWSCCLFGLWWWPCFLFSWETQAPCQSMVFFQMVCPAGGNVESAHGRDWSYLATTSFEKNNCGRENASGRKEAVWKELPWDTSVTVDFWLFHVRCIQVLYDDVKLQQSNLLSERPYCAVRAHFDDNVTQ